MELYGGIDLHGNNNVISLMDKQNKIVFEKRLANDLQTVLTHLEPYRDDIVSLAVESTYNWYWLVDGLLEASYPVLLANPAAMQQYDGLKYSDDKTDARWIANMQRLGVLPCGYIYPKEDRAIRDLLRKRSQLVRYRTSNILSISNLIARNNGVSISGEKIKRFNESELGAQFENELIALAAKSNFTVMKCVIQQIKRIEKEVKKRAKLRPEFEPLLTVNGIGDILAMTIAYETGDISRFPSAKDFSSYCRCVRSERLSNKKKKGKGNVRNGNRFLAWTFIEAATFSLQYNEKARRFYQRKSAKSKPAIAKKALANKLAKACFYIMRDQVPFDNERLFAT